MPAPIDVAPGAAVSGELDFSVVSQKVVLDIDFVNRSITGSTTITAQPLTKSLKTFLLHCRQCRVLSATVQNRPAGFRYNDPYNRTAVWDGRASIRQHEHLRSRISRSIGQSPSPDLTIVLPPRVAVKDLDTDTFPFPQPKNTEADGHRRDSDHVETPILPTAVEPANGYAPMEIHITFKVDNFRDGLHFVGFSPRDSRYPHLYTKNMLFPGTSSSIFPCVDTATARCMWEISIRCPKTLGDAFRLPPGPEDREDSEPRYAIPLSDEDRQLELVVVCSGATTDDITDPDDVSRKTVSFACATPVSARHVGFAIGPFQVLDLSAEFRQTDEDDKLGQSAVKVLTYSLPGRANEVRNTCMTMSMAVDYFTVTFGSFPFPSYQMCFVDDLSADIADAAGLSVCSNRLLFKEDQLEPLDSHTRIITRALAVQYSGVNVIPKDPADIWVTTGIAGFMTDIFMKKIAGNNEYRFRQKLATDKVHEIDIDRYSIHQLGGQLDIDPSELEFLWLKSALVLFILDRRLTKVSGSAGMSRIVTRLLLNAKTGSLPNNEITTEHFMRLCEKLGHTKLDTFFRQWVYGAGCPDFRVSQSFNKKKLVVDMIFEQTQSKRTEKPRLHPKTFLRDAKEQVAEAWVPAVQPIFTGPMTIRIHEADGTPYEHIVEIRDMVTRIEIPYNTKYKRLKRTKKSREKGTANTDPNAGGDGENDSLLYCLGDTLQTDQEMKDWRLVEWDAEIENLMSQESYEWIRLDADFEWIGQFRFHMKPYMYVSQLQQDRDVVAQYESLQNIVMNDPHPMMSTILVRTLMDRRYFHGIRTMAAKGLSKCAHPAVDNIGLFHLEKTYQELLCSNGSLMPRPNDFSNQALYLIQCAILEAMALIRDDKGGVPRQVRRFLLDTLKLNDNSLNAFSDNDYIACLLKCLARTVSVSVQAVDAKNDPFAIDIDDEPEKDPEDERIKNELLTELDRYRRMDEWISSHHNVFSTAAVECLCELVKANIVERSSGIFDILQYTRPANAEIVRLRAFEALVELKAARKPQMFKYILHSLADDPSPAMRANLLSVVGQALGSIAIGDDNPPPRQVEQTMDLDTGLVLEQDVQVKHTQDDIERKTSPAIALDLLKDTVKDTEVLQQAMWHAIQAPSLSLNEMVDLLDVAALLFDSSTIVGSLVWVKPMPRTYKASHLGGGEVVFNKTESVRWRPSKYSPLSLVDFKRVQANGLKYTGPVVQEAKEIKPVESVKLKLGSKPLGPPVSALPTAKAFASAQMPAPPVPHHTDGPAKISLKRKQSIDGATLASPKLPKAMKPTPRQTPSPSPLVLSRSPSSNATRAPSATPGPSSIVKTNGHKASRMVVLKTGRHGHKVDIIMSGSTRALAKCIILKIKNYSRPSNAPTSAALPPLKAVIERRSTPASSKPPSRTSQGDTATQLSTKKGLFTNMDGMQAGWNMGGFRNFSRGDIKPSEATEAKPDVALGTDAPLSILSAVSPRTVWPPGRPVSSDSSLTSTTGGTETRPGTAAVNPAEEMPKIERGALPSLERYTQIPTIEKTPAAPEVKDESSDEEPLMQVRQQTPQPQVPSRQTVQTSRPPSPKRLGLLKLKFGKKS